MAHSSQEVRLYGIGPLFLLHGITQSLPAVKFSLLLFTDIPVYQQYRNHIAALIPGLWNNHGRIPLSVL